MAYLLKIDKYEGQPVEGSDGLEDSWGYEVFTVDPTTEKIKLGWFASLDASGNMIYADASTGKKAITAIYTSSAKDAFGAYVTNPNKDQAYFYTVGAREYRKLAEQTKMTVVIGLDTGVILRQYFRIKNAVLTGTCATTATSATVTGTGTKFTTELKVGEKILIGAVAFVVSAIASDTSLTVATAAAGSASAQALTGVGMYGEPLYLAASGGDLPFTMLKPTSNVQIVGKIVGKTVALYNIRPEML